jgi:hypothetical protein
MTFYLGTHETHWLATAGIPLFVSRRRLALKKSHRPAAAPWALDSGGFTELSMFGEWRTPIAQYVAEVRRWMAEIGKMAWAACQDWMCEEFILKQTGLTVLDHQTRTIDNYIALRTMAPEVPWVPVLQGWLPWQYEDHVEAYSKRGVDLFALPTVGLGSVCRRQHTFRIEMLIRTLASAGLKLHGFGFKLMGLSRAADALTSADSLAWSYDARRSAPMPGHTHKNCANCLPFALDWRDQVLDRIEAGSRQGVLVA